MAEHPSTRQPDTTDADSRAASAPRDASGQGASRLRKLDCSETPASPAPRTSPAATPPDDCQGR